MRPSALLVLTTVPDRAAARRLAGRVLDAGLAACATVSGPVESHYTWKGRRECAQERAVLFKLPARGYAALEALLRSVHPYECPEILAFPAAAGWPPYLAWLEAQVPPVRTPRKKTKKNATSR